MSKFPGRVLFLLMLGLPFTAQADLNVFACEPEWAALSEEIGGSLVNAASATNAMQDPHYIEARPSLISKVHKADLAQADVRAEVGVVLT